jgi:hypothetical protein
MSFSSGSGVPGAREDQFTSAIESQTSKIPSSGYLGAAIGAMVVSAILKSVGKNDWAMFVASGRHPSWSSASITKWSNSKGQTLTAAARHKLH